MKIFIALIALLFIAFIVIQIYSMSSQKNIESYRYDVIKSYENFEVRMYEPALFTSVQITNNGYSEASGKGFSLLGGYIFGANEKK